VRAMQVIDELEGVRRGPYCGATGLLANDGSFTLNVAIRTIALSGRGDPRRPAHLDGTLDYWAGCGIVAESDPRAEWDESVAKSEVLLRTLA
jgi:anthranilate/para-aminobenzoate synthase component I